MKIDIEGTFKAMLEVSFGNSQGAYWGEPGRNAVRGR